MATLSRQQLLQTWQGLQALIKGLPSGMVPTASVEGLNDEALIARINSQLTSIDNNASLGRQAAVNPDGPVPDLSQPGALPVRPGARGAAISTIKTALNTPADADMGQFNALLAAYADGYEFTIPDFALDDTITDSERQAAEEIVRRLEAGENAPEIRAAFGAQATTIAEQQRIAAEAEAARLAAEESAARQQANLESAVDAHLAATGYIKPEQIGRLTDNQRANWLTEFLKDNQIQLTAEGAASMKYGDLGDQQNAAINAETVKIQPAALEILAAGRQGDHMAEEVKQWLDGGDTAQIMMAQATIGVGVTGDIDSVTHAMGEQYIQASYAASLNEIPGLLNPGGSVNPSLTWEAANEGRLYMPSAEELRAAGVDEATLASIEAAPPASELLPQRAALEGKAMEDFTDADRLVWVSDTREELIANAYIANPQLYESVIAARNTVAATTTLAAAPPVDVEAPSIELPVVEVAPADATPLEERAAANNPLDLRATNPDVIGGESLAGGSAYNNAADGKTANGTLTFDGPDTSLQMVVNHIRPAEGTLNMEDALYRVHYIQTSEQEAFLGGAMGSGGAPSGSYAGRIAIELGYEPNHQFDFNDPKQLNDLLTGVIASTNYASLPGEGNILERFKNSDDPAVVSMRESIERVSKGEPLLGDQPAVTPDEPAPAVDGEALTSSVTPDAWAGTEHADGADAKGDRLINTDGSFNGSFVAPTTATTGTIELNARFGDTNVAPSLPEADPALQEALESYAAKRAAQLTTPGPT